MVTGQWPALVAWMATMQATTKGFGYDRPKANGCFYDFTPTQLPFWDSCSIPKIADSNKCRNLFGNVFTNLVIPSQGHIFPALAVEPELNGNQVHTPWCCLFRSFFISGGLCAGSWKCLLWRKPVCSCQVPRYISSSNNISYISIKRYLIYLNQTHLISYWIYALLYITI